MMQWKLYDMQSARKRPSVEELVGHPWIAAHCPLDWGPAVSDAASQQHVQLPPPQQLVTIMQALKKHGSLKEVPKHSYMAATPQNASLTERCFPVLGSLDISALLQDITAHGSCAVRSAIVLNLHKDSQS